MTRRLVACTLLALGISAPAWAQQITTPPSLSEVFQDLFGPNGLVVDSNATLPNGQTHSSHFNSSFQSDFTQFDVALASQLTSLPLPSPASGFTYRFDPSTGTFVRSSQSFGPILTDRAETIGRGRFSFGYNFQYFSFDHFEGIDLAHVPAVFRHDDFEEGDGRTDVVSTSNAISASVGQWTGALTYGVSDHLDISVAVPIVRTSLSVVSAATIERIGTGPAKDVHFFQDPDAPGGLGSERTFESGATATGLGDVILRAKGELLHQARQGLSAGLDLRLPTGDERNLLGSGAWGARPFVAYSASSGRVSPHVNVSYQWNGESVLAGDPTTGAKGDVPDQFQYALGADFGVTERFSITGDWLSRLSIDSPRVNLQTQAFTGDYGSVTLQNIAFDRGSFWSSSAAFGCKMNAKGRLLVDFNLRFSVTDNGLTDRVTPLIGLEYTF
jgi:hypothetical protein